MNQLLGNILFDLYQFSSGLNKHHFQWTRAPKGLQVLAGTDTTGLVKWQGKDIMCAMNGKQMPL